MSRHVWHVWIYVWHTMTHHDIFILVIFILFIQFICITCMYGVVSTWSFRHLLWDYENELELKNKWSKLWKFAWQEQAFELHTVRSLIYNNLTNSPSICKNEYIYSTSLIISSVTTSTSQQDIDHLKLDIKKEKRSCTTSSSPWTL